MGQQGILNRGIPRYRAIIHNVKIQKILLLSSLLSLILLL